MKFSLKKYRSVLTPEEKKQRNRQLLMAVSSGVALGLSFPPIPMFFLAFIALVPYFYALRERTTLSGINRLTYVMAFFFNLITIYWVGSWTPEADPFLMISGAALMFVNPAFFLIPSTLWYFARKKFSENVSFMLFPFFWVTYEYLYTITDFRFPWLTLGNGQPYFHYFIQIADITGVYGLSLFILFTNVFVFRAILKKRAGKPYLTNASIALLFVLLPVIYGVYKTSVYEYPEKTIRIGVVQPNLNPWNKWDAGNLQAQVDMYLEMSSEVVEQDADLILWPETALPVYLLTAGYAEHEERIHKFVEKNEVFILTGMPDATFYFEGDNYPPEAKPFPSGRGTYTSYNSIILFSPLTREVEKYGKIKLVPFGEKVPLVDYFPFLGDFIKWNVGISSWNTGQDTVVFNVPVNREGSVKDTVKVAGLICIESIYPDFAASFIQKDAGFIAVVTNDSWYGNSSGPRQHKEISVIRAVENRKSVVRAANGGISAVIDPLGNILFETELFTRSSFVKDVYIDRSETFFTRYPLIVPLFSVIVSVWITGIFIMLRVKNGNKRA